ncbi:MAG: acyltransferase [Deltaproteobacteria bacterium]|nr:acyltransferase [Deltaproteobacteria bacterium]
MQAQLPDPDVLYERGGMFLLGAYLTQCYSSEIIREVLAKYGADIHRDTWPVGPNITVMEAQGSFANLSVGAFSHIDRGVVLDLTDKITIEDCVSIGTRAMIFTHMSVGDAPDKPTAKLLPRKQQGTILRRGCSVGAGAIILCGVEIGEDAVINAGVVVDRDVPARTIVTNSRVQNDYTMPERFFQRAKG